MGHQRSRVHENSSQGEVQQDQRSTLTLISGGSDEHELPLQRVMDTIPGWFGARFQTATASSATRGGWITQGCLSMKSKDGDGLQPFIPRT